MDKPIILPIKETADENPFVKTFYFDYAFNSRPGQFVMLWLPGLDQKPFSVGSDDGKKIGLTIFKRGPLTEKLFSLKPGDRVGLTGPYGNPFTLKPDVHYIMIAGGYGAAPLAFLAEEAAKQNSTVDFLLGARSADYLLFEKRLTGISGLKLHLATDDGSKGYKGYVTDLLPDLAGGHEKIMMATCGPELMEKKILDFCNQRGLDCEISLERYMKCGFGLCGQCAVDPVGLCVCKNGPVFPKAIINQITEFGKYHRDKSGKINNF